MRASWAATPFPSALCISINEEVVHGLPIPSRVLYEGDIVSIDCGLEYRGLFTRCGFYRRRWQGFSLKRGKRMKVTEECLVLFGSNR